MTAHIDLDLDSFAGKPYVVRLNKKSFKIQRIKLRRLINLIQLAKNVDIDTDRQDESLLELLESLTDLCPELKNEDLEITQMQALVGFLAENSSPDDQKELKKRGIELSGDQKKVRSVSSKK